MKKVLAAAAIVALGATAALAENGNSNIKNSMHNMSYSDTVVSGAYGVGTSANTDQICVYCHTPHNAIQNIPIWNRNNPAGTDFTLYSSVTMANSKHKTGFTSDSISLFCMSCHDGGNLGTRIANGPFLNGTHMTNGYNGTISGDARLGTNLSSTHPVNFRVITNNQPRNNGTNDLNLDSGNNSMGSTKFPLFVSGGQNAYLECASCHSVHDDFYNPFLRDTMAASKLCLGCHNK